MKTYVWWFVAVIIFIGLLLMVILLPLALERVAFDEAAILYNKVTKKLGTEVKREGLHHIGVGGELLKFKTTQRTATMPDLKALTSDGLELTLDVAVAFTVDTRYIREIIDHFGDQDHQEMYILRLCESVVRDVSSTFNASRFYLAREEFQTAVNDEIEREFQLYDVRANRSFVQVIDINLGSFVETALKQTTVAEQDVQNALAERFQEIQAAEFRLGIAQKTANLTILEAERDASLIDQEAEQSVLVERTRQLLRTYAFSNISQALNKGGDFFVNSYLKALVTQSNEGKTIIGL